jgi:hypothetical protein
MRQEFHSPSRPSKSTLSGNDDRNVDASFFSMPAPPFRSGNSELGSGLEGFVVEHSGTDLISDRSTESPALGKTHLLVKPMGTFLPSESFGSIQSAVNTSNAPLNVAEDDVYSTIHPPLSVGEEADNTFLLTSPGRRQSDGYTRQYIQDLSELPTPRIDHTKGKRELSRELKKNSNKITDMPLALTSSVLNGSCHPQNEITNDPDLGYPFPPPPLFVPDLSIGSDVTRESLGNVHVDAPRSVLLEELQLVRMESGVSGPRWRTKYDLQQDETRLQNQRQESENMKKLKEASSFIENDPRNSIQHIRKDLTISSDASSSLSSKISFSELKLVEVIGGGGFGQVWRARWKGTPVAVKVLTGSAQAETVPKAVLEEFIAEINMVSGMRHPNICLFMGACLDPPNRAIVTELCENGSLWDALRSPLSIYQAADGKTRLAWPLDLYDPISKQFDSTHKKTDSLFAPAGAWPWALVKRVAAGTARGMCYLHSGTPPVLHRGEL